MAFVSLDEFARFGLGPGGGGQLEHEVVADHALLVTRRQPRAPLLAAELLKVRDSLLLAFHFLLAHAFSLRGDQGEFVTMLAVEGLEALRVLVVDALRFGFAARLQDALVVVVLTLPLLVCRQFQGAAKAGPCLTHEFASGTAPEPTRVAGSLCELNQRPAVVDVQAPRV